MPIAGSRQSISPIPRIMKYPTMIRTGAVASGGITPASGERKTQRRNNTPVTTDASPVRPPSLIPEADLDERGVRRRARGATRGRRERVDEQHPVHVRQLAVLVEQTRLLTEADRRPHRVEEVRQHDREHRDDRRPEPEGREEPEREVPQETEVGRRGHRVRNLRDPRPEGVPDRVVAPDPVDDRPRSTVVGDDRDQETALRSCGRPGSSTSASPIANVQHPQRREVRREPERTDVSPALHHDRPRSPAR